MLGIVRPGFKALFSSEGFQCFMACEASVLVLCRALRWAASISFSGASGGIYRLSILGNFILSLMVPVQVSYKCFAQHQNYKPDKGGCKHGILLLRAPFGEETPKCSNLNPKPQNPQPR